jgi:hypothetical protein
VPVTTPALWARLQPGNCPLITVWRMAANVLAYCEEGEICVKSRSRLEVKPRGGAPGAADEAPAAGLGTRGRSSPEGEILGRL